MTDASQLAPTQKTQENGKILIVTNGCLLFALRIHVNENIK